MFSLQKYFPFTFLWCSASWRSENIITHIFRSNNLVGQWKRNPPIIFLTLKSSLFINFFLFSLDALINSSTRSFHFVKINEVIDEECSLLDVRETSLTYTLCKIFFNGISNVYCLPRFFSVLQIGPFHRPINRPILFIYCLPRFFRMIQIISYLLQFRTRAHNKFLLNFRGIQDESNIIHCNLFN